MKRILFIALSGFLVLFLPAGPQAQVNTILTLNYTIPADDIIQATDPGFGVSGEVFTLLPLLPVKLGLHLAYNRFFKGDDARTGDLNILEFMPAIKYNIKARDTYALWTQVGFGVFRWENDGSNQNDIGYLFGIGYMKKISDAIGIVLMPTYQKIFSEKISFFTVNLGIRF